MGIFAFAVNKRYISIFPLDRFKEKVSEVVENTRFNLTGAARVVEGASGALQKIPCSNPPNLVFVFCVVASLFVVNE